MKTTVRCLTAVATLMFGLAVPAMAQANPKSLCIYDPGGKSGDFNQILQDYKLQTKTWNVDVELKIYTDEETAVKDYEANKCDGVLATGVRMQRFNRFPSTVEAIGAVTEYDTLKSLVGAFVRYPSAAARLRSGVHETIGILPAGKVYLYVRDRKIDTVGELAGKRIATMTYDKASPVMVGRVGAIVVAADLGSLGPKFNNGSVDACYMSALAYEPFELWRGMSPDGGVIELPLAMATLQLMVHHESFPADFGAKSRAWFAGQFDRAQRAVQREEDKIDKKYWIKIPPADLPGFEDMFLKVRLDLRDKHKAYDGTMLSTLRKLRCAKDASRSECVEKKE
ncbi:MAG: hypothetical protein ACI9MC_002837 [Kiritimatiellia bacterium]|jgi:hypothetical protein